MSSCCGVGAMSRIAIGLSSGTPTRMDFNWYYGNKVTKLLSDGSSETIRGTLDPVDTNIGEGILSVQFRVQMWLTQPKFDILLPCFGFSESPTDTWTLGNVLPPLKVILGPAGAPEVTYDDCIVTDWGVSGRRGKNPILLDMGFIGKTRAEAAAGTFFVSQTSPAMLEGWVYPYPDGSFNVTRFNVQGLDRLFPSFKLDLDYQVIDEFNQSVTATNLCPTGHQLMFGAGALYSTCDSTTDLLTDPMDGDTTGDELVVELAREADAVDYTTMFTVANAKLIAREYNMRKRQFNMLPIQAKGFALADGTPMLVIENSAV